MENEILQESLPKRGRGRPAFITLPVVQEVARLIAKGMTEEQARLRVGVNHDSLRTARHRNTEFETAVKEGQAEFLDEALDRIAEGKHGWQGLAWILERRHGDQFRRTTGMEVNAHVAPFSPADLLPSKPLTQWTREDVEQSVGMWRLLRCWSAEQLAQLGNRYQQEWGPPSELSDEKLEWSIEIIRRIGELKNGGERAPGSLEDFVNSTLAQHASTPPEIVFR